MGTSRHCRRFARLVLVWFACALGAAAASPLVREQGQQLVCSASGQLRFVAFGDDAGAMRGSGALQDCPLCILAGAPPPGLQLAIAMPAPSFGPMARVGRSTHPASRSAPPLPPRGPPVPL